MNLARRKRNPSKRARAPTVSVVASDTTPREEVVVQNGAFSVVEAFAALPQQP